MLKDLDELTQPIINIYNSMELALIEEIAARFDVTDEISGTLEWQLKKLDEMGALNAKAIDIISKYTKKSQPEIIAMLKKAGFSNIDLDALAEGFNEGLLTVDPYKIMESPAMAATLELSYKELAAAYKLINTHALESVKRAYMDTINRAYIEVSSGVYDYNTAIKRAIQGMASAGIEGATYKRGDVLVRYSLEGTIRRDTLTAVHQLSNKITIQSCEELQAEYVEVSQHRGARVHPTNHIANHAWWQGKVYKINGFDEKYGNLKSNTGYPDDILGLGGVNCRHRIFPFFPQFTKPNAIMYDKDEAERNYKLSQQQRKQERDIRGLKKRIVAAQACGDKESATKYNKKLKAKIGALQSFCNNNGLKMDYSRLLVKEQV